MEKETKQELQRIINLGTRLGVLIRMEIFEMNESIGLLVEKVLTYSNFPQEIESKVIKNIPLLLAKVAAFIDDAYLFELQKAIIRSNMSPVSFVQSMKIETINSQELLELDTYMDDSLVPTEEKLRALSLLVSSANVIDFSEKTVGQEVMIGHTLFTNMLVTPEGVQMPSKDFQTPAVAELMGLKAVVTEVQNKKMTYVCGACKSNHNADVRIAFEEFNMEFYINNSFLKPYEHEEA